MIPGAEITRNKPLGHLNALFLKDANALDIEDPLIAIDNALEQGAFIMWESPDGPMILVQQSASRADKAKKDTWNRISERI